MVNRGRDTVLNCTVGGLFTNEPADLGIENQHVQLNNFCGTNLGEELYIMNV